ncbi:MAG: O-antigen ligase family protein [Deltaproteobacteria bacterium]|nr:O-antigen ligase family protein [Deltaproteobacteria bacterium]
MFAIPGILLLMVATYARPHELVPALKSIPILYMFFGLALYGLVLDMKLRVSRPPSTPQLPWVGLLIGWALLGVAVRNSSELVPSAVHLGVGFIVYFVIAHGVQTFRTFQVLAATILTVCLFIAMVGVHQGLAPWGCAKLDQDLHAVPDGRSCEQPLDCRGVEAEPGVEYVCERLGLFGTTSIGGRVRYLGMLQDPNETALAVAIGIPFAFAFAQRRRSLGRKLFLLFALILVATCVVLTKSRGGQLVMMSVLAVYFVKQFGPKGLILGAILAAPALLLGGRSGEEASQSSQERLEAWRTGIDLFRQFPLMGVGQGQFTEHHYLTAHNSYMLTVAELGFPGLMIWGSILYISLKIPRSAMSYFANKPEAEVALTWALALHAALVGLLAGIFFLSFSYHFVLWIYVGLCGAFYSAAKTHDPEWEVTFGRRDLLAVGTVATALVTLIFLYTRVKHG